MIAINPFYFEMSIVSILARLARGLQRKPYPVIERYSCLLDQGFEIKTILDSNIFHISRQWLSKYYPKEAVNTVNG